VRWFRVPTRHAGRRLPSTGIDASQHSLRAAAEDDDGSVVDRSTRVSEQRTAFLVERGFLAFERTLMARLRTSLSMIGFDFSLAKSFAHLSYDQDRAPESPGGRVVPEKQGLPVGRRSVGAGPVTRGPGMRALHRNNNRQALDILGAGDHHYKLRSMAARVRNRSGVAGLTPPRPGARPFQTATTFGETRA
jgi:uncharacterized membrane protein YidH (DUF202 family)